MIVTSHVAVYRKRLLGPAAFAWVCLMLSSAATAQQLPDLTDLFPPSQGGDGTTTPSDGPGTTPVTGGRQTIITNQFTSAGAGAIQARRPGLWLQQAIAEHQGAMEFSGDVPEDQVNFFKQMFDQVALGFVDFFTGLLQGLNSFIPAWASSSSSGQAVFIPISNAATTGQGTTTQIQ